MKFQTKKMANKQMNNSNHELQTKAKELLEKHGKSAVEVAKRKAGAFQQD